MIVEKQRARPSGVAALQNTRGTMSAVRFPASYAQQNQADPAKQKQRKPQVPSGLHPGEDASVKWLGRALELDYTGQNRKAVRVIFSEVDRLLRSGAKGMVTCNFILVQIANEATSLSREALLAFLTITHAARAYLPSRAELYRQTSQILQQRGEDARRIVHGLE
jgi:hypothetical protein